MIKTDNFRATIMMVASMLAFAFEDMLIVKSIDVGLSIGQVLFLVGLIGGAIFWAMALLRGEAILVRAALRPLPLFRSLSEGAGALFFVTALSLMPFTLCSAILQASPLLVTIGAWLFLTESVGWRRWIAIFVGFAGVITILRPGTDEFIWASLFAVAGMIFIAGRDLVTRVIHADVTILQISTWAYMALSMTGLSLMLVEGEGIGQMSLPQLRNLAGAVLSGVLGYWLVTSATRLGEASFVAPFRYTRLVFSMVLGVIFLVEKPDVTTVIGAALITASGCYMLLRESNRKRVSLRRKSL